VGETYQVDCGYETYPGVAAGGDAAHPNPSRERRDDCMWDPVRAEAEGIDVPAYLAAAAKLYEVASPPQPFSAELALRLLLKHTFDAAAATHQLATYIGVEKVLRPEAPVKAETAIVRGRAGVRVGLHLTLSHLTASMSDKQPQGFVRSTRSRTEVTRRHCHHHHRHHSPPPPPLTPLPPPRSAAPRRPSRWF